MSGYAYQQRVDVTSHSYIRKQKNSQSEVASEVAGGTTLIAAPLEDSDGDPVYPKWYPVEYNMGNGILVHGFIAEGLVLVVPEPAKS